MVVAEMVMLDGWHCRDQVRGESSIRDSTLDELIHAILALRV